MSSWGGESAYGSNSDDTFFFLKCKQIDNETLFTVN